MYVTLQTPWKRGPSFALQSATAPSKTLWHLSNGVPSFLLQIFTMLPSHSKTDVITLTERYVFEVMKIDYTW